ncbi:hypothetical protein BDR05DRAFT_935759 [Suillus weaverae]|nr:hypothetical protein BDR05DRAFT_935759 [Suillus weaverae]
MPRIHNDPNFNICPDYASDTFVNTRAQLINDNITEEQAVQLLRNIWEANNDVDKILWQQQVENDREQRAQNKNDWTKLESMRRMLYAKKREKKNKHKYVPILATGIPDDTAITPCSYVLQKLDKGEYVELWYFTNDGLDEDSLKKMADDDAMILSTLADGSTAWVSSASTRNACAIVSDEDLPFEDFCQACPCFITAMEEADWPADRVRMMALFWRNIQVHRLRSVRDPIAQKTLLVYQAKQRKRWHVASKSSVGPYDLSLVNERVLEAMREKVYWVEQNKRDNAHDYKVSSHFFSKTVSTF